MTAESPTVMTVEDRCELCGRTTRIEAPVSQHSDFDRVEMLMVCARTAHMRRWHLSDGEAG